MTRACLIDATGLVVNTIIVGDDYTPPEGLTLVVSNDGGIGDTYSDTDGFTPGPAPEVDAVPVSSVSRRQFFLGLYVWNLLDTAQVAVDAAGGTTKISWDTASEFRITDPTLTSVVNQIGKGDQLQDFFDFCSTL